MIIFHILVCVWMCFCLAFPRQEPIFQPLHSSPTATSTGSPRLSERGWQALPLENQGAPPPSVWPSDWSAGSQTTSSGAVTVMLLLRREGGKGPLFCSSCCWILIWAVRKGKDRKEKSDDVSWEWEKGAKKTRGEQGVGERMEEVRKKSRWKRCNGERKEEMVKYDEEKKMRRRII